MGTLILFTIISLFAGMYSLVVSLENGGSGGFFWIVAIVLNIAVVIRMFYEKAKMKDKRFRTAQIVYIVGVAIATISWIILLFSEISDSNIATVTLCLGLCVALWTIIFNIGGTYLVCYLNSRNKPDESPFDQFFLPGGEKREIKKHLRAALGWIGAISIVVAIGVFVVGGFDSMDNGDVAYTSCYKCDGIGKYNKNGVLVSCGSCNGSGIGAYRESGENIMSSTALWLGALGIGSLAMIKVLKDDE